jgi:hypothetical protein
MDTWAATYFYVKKNINAGYENKIRSISQNHICLIISRLCLSIFIAASSQTFGQQTWVSFSPKEQAYHQPAAQEENQLIPYNHNTTLLSSGRSGVSFAVHIDGMTVNQKNYGADSYQAISIPGGDLINKEGSPQLPVVVKLIAIPDCDNVNISISASNELYMSNYNIIPAPGFSNELSDDGNQYGSGNYLEKKSIYSEDSFYPGTNGEIIETGYVRGQKVARVALYPVQFNPVEKTLKIHTDFVVSLNFTNPKSDVNKEVGIFRNMLNYTALNYKPDGINASSKNLNLLQSSPIYNDVQKINNSGSVTRVNNVKLLADSNGIPVDYLVVTHSSLFNSPSLTRLAEYRAKNNGFDVAIVQVDDDIYNAYPGRPHYQSLRDFISDVYSKGRANHTGDGHLGYIVLVGDAYTDPPDQKEMVPAAYPAYYSQYEQGGDYYYTCTGGDSDDLQDLIYGRISVGNEDELSNVVDKTIAYESLPPAGWKNNVSFMSYTPWFFNDDETCDQYFYQMAHIIPRTNYISYAWRGFAEDTANAWGRIYFKDHLSDQRSIANVPADINEIWNERFTGWRWYKYDLTSNTYQVMEGGQYMDSLSDCGAGDIDNWLYDKLNEGQHFLIYEGHSGHGSLGEGEGAGRRIFRIDQVDGKLHNFEKYPFIIANGCETGEFDATAVDDMGYIDCLAEKIVDMKDAGAIGFLGSVRESSTSAFNHVDKYVLDAFYNNSAHLMGEAVMESKLLLYSTFRRQCNLYGDPAVNLFNSNTLAAVNGSGDVSANQEFELGNNYPNPFNPATTINYKLKNSGFVKLKIFDALGREVKTLVNENKNPGTYSVVFNGNHQASGVYYYQLKVNTSGRNSSAGESYIFTKKMLLLK